MEDTEAIIRLKQGDLEGLAVLIQRYQVKALRTAYLITQERALAEDVTQGVFIRLAGNIHQFDHTRSFAPWLMRCIANAAVQASQRYQRQESLDAELAFENLLVDPAPIPDDTVEQQELESIIEQTLQQLSPQQRAVIILRYYAGLSESEMAVFLDTPPGTIKSRLYKARRRLRGLLPPFLRPLGVQE